MLKDADPKSFETQWCGSGDSSHLRRSLPATPSQLLCKPVCKCWLPYDEPQAHLTRNFTMGNQLPSASEGFLANSHWLFSPWPLWQVLESRLAAPELHMWCKIGIFFEETQRRCADSTSTANRRKNIQFCPQTNKKARLCRTILFVMCSSGAACR